MHINSTISVLNEMFPLTICRLQSGEFMTLNVSTFDITRFSSLEVKVSLVTLRVRSF